MQFPSFKRHHEECENAIYEQSWEDFTITKQLDLRIYKEILHSHYKMRSKIQWENGQSSRVLRKINTK